METIIAFIKKAQAYAKAIVAGAGTILVAVSGLSEDFGITIIPVEAQPWITFTLAVLTAFATWAVPNAGFVDSPADNGLGGVAPELEA
jgi:hypothetical protein